MPSYRRQHPIDPYGLDLYCAKARHAIESDGMSHDIADRPQRDIRRDAWLEAEGVTVMRIAAGEVTGSSDDIVDAIVRTAAAKLEAAAPSTALNRGPSRNAGEDSDNSRPAPNMRFGTTPVLPLAAPDGIKGPIRTIGSAAPHRDNVLGRGRAGHGAFCGASCNSTASRTSACRRATSRWPPIIAASELLAPSSLRRCAMNWRCETSSPVRSVA